MKNLNLDEWPKGKMDKFRLALNMGLIQINDNGKQGKSVALTPMGAMQWARESRFE
jgi:hypothetical protein